MTLLDDEADLPKWTRVLYPTNWPEDNHFTFGEKKMRNLCKRLRLNERQNTCGFR